MTALLAFTCYAVPLALLLLMHARLWTMSKKLDALLEIVGGPLAARLRTARTELETAIATDSPSGTTAGATKLGE